MDGLRTDSPARKRNCLGDCLNPRPHTRTTLGRAQNLHLHYPSTKSNHSHPVITDTVTLFFHFCFIDHAISLLGSNLKTRTKRYTNPHFVRATENRNFVLIKIVFVPAEKLLSFNIVQ